MKGRIDTSEDGMRFFFKGDQELVYTVLDRVPGAKPTRNGGAHVKASPAIAADFVAALKEHDIEFDDQWLELYQAWSEATSVAEIVRIATMDELPPFKSATVPWLHQAQAFHFLRSLPAGALFSDMGTGKTKVVVDLICNSDPGLTLIVGPLKTIEDKLWTREFGKHAACQVDINELGPSFGKVRERAEILPDLIFFAPTVITMNYEAFDQEVMRSAVSKIRWDLVVLDESHRIKAVTGVRSKFFGKLGRNIPHRLILTGTPNADKPIDVWGQFRFLDPSIFGNYGEFKRRYCHLRLMPNGQGGYFEKIEGYKNLDDLASRMSSVAFRVTSDVLDLPDQHDVIRRVRLGNEAQRIYTRMEKDALAAVEEENDVIASNVLTKYLRLQEITSGYLRSDEESDGGTHRAIRRFDTSKADATIEIIEDIGDAEPVAIFYRFTEDASLLTEKLKDTRATFELSGRLNELQRWKDHANGECQGYCCRVANLPRGGVLLVQIAAGSEGIDLTAARYCIYYSTDFSLSHYEQSRKRIHRPGQTRPVTYYHIQAEGTVDEYIWNALSNKADISGTISQYILAKHKGDDNAND